MEEDLIFKKATLALGGAVLLPPGFEPPVRISRSTAGPGAGFDSAAFSFGRMRVKKSVSYDSGEFELHLRGDGSLYLTHHGEPFIDDIRFEHVVHHCPGQSFFTIDHRCGYRCAFCTSPRIPVDGSKLISDSEIAERAMKAHEEYGTTAVSLTSGVPEGDVESEVSRFISCIKEIRTVLPDIPIGIEPYVTTEDQVWRLKESGADEIKINIQTATPELMKAVCPDFDRDNVLRCIGYAVKWFGRGRVTSNIITGLGETPEQLETCIREVCGLGAVPTIRGLRWNDINRVSLEAAIGRQPETDPARMIYDSRLLKKVLAEYGMTTTDFKTMCIECGCCDLVPFRDF